MKKIITACCLLTAFSCGGGQQEGSSRAAPGGLPSPNEDFTVSIVGGEYSVFAQETPGNPCCYGIKSGLLTHEALLGEPDPLHLPVGAAVDMSFLLPANWDVQCVSSILLLTSTLTDLELVGIDFDYIDPDFIRIQLRATAGPTSDGGVVYETDDCPAL